MFENFEDVSMDVDDGVVVGRIGPGGSAASPRPALLLLHGHPQTHVMWHGVADRLVEDFQVIALDLPGYGRSVPRRDGVEHPMSKRAMADQILAAVTALGEQHGFDRFAVCAHDRGARVAHRLCLDHPERVRAAMFLDIAPLQDMFEAADRAFATAYWHWFFLSQPEPLPETLLGSNPDAYLDGLLGPRRGTGPFAPEAMDAYRSAFADPAVIHANCEDYRAAAGIDLEMDRDGRAAGERLSVPLRVLWGSRGVLGTMFEPLDLWRAVADSVDGRQLAAGHFLAEEQPDEVLGEIREFLSASS